MTKIADALVRLLGGLLAGVIMWAILVAILGNFLPPLGLLIAWADGDWEKFWQIVEMISCIAVPAGLLIGLASMAGAFEED